MKSEKLLLVFDIFIGCVLCNAAYDPNSQFPNQYPNSQYPNQYPNTGYPYSHPQYPGQFPPYSGYVPTNFEGREFWSRMGEDEINNAFRRPVNWQQAKNIIIMVCDGMDPNTVTAARILKESERGKLSFERFPHMGLLKTYSTNKKVPDSAATGTALFTGIKTNNDLVGVDSLVQPGECMGSLQALSRASSIMEWAQVEGKNTGFITNKRVTEAITSSLYAHSASKYWECNSNVPEGMCKDIARQLIEDEPGRSLKVIFGGGRQTLKTDPYHDMADKVDLFACQRTDGRDLMEEWSRDKHQKGIKSTIVHNSQELMELDTSRTEYALGLFANSHLPFETDRNKSVRGVPSLEMMVEPAIKILRRYRHPGFVLTIHSGLVDKAHHEGNARKALEETMEFDKAVARVNQVLYDLGITNETLVIVTGGHGHTMSINGYPDRNSSILGIAERSKHDSIPYTTLTYATGPSPNYQYRGKNDMVLREDPMNADTLSKEYHQQATILTDKETHGGGDVSVYATGPHAGMFYGVHEQTYVAYVMAFAARMGPYRNSGVQYAPTILTFLCSFMVFVRRNTM